MLLGSRGAPRVRRVAHHDGPKRSGDRGDIRNLLANAPFALWEGFGERVSTTTDAAKAAFLMESVDVVASNPTRNPL